MAIDLKEFEKNLREAAAEIASGKETREFLRKEGNKLMENTKKVAKSRVKKRTGEYLKSIKRGKAWTNKDVSGVRAYSGIKYANTIESGRLGSNGGYIKGAHVFRDSEKEFKKEFDDDVAVWVNDLLSKKV